MQRLAFLSAAVLMAAFSVSAQEYKLETISTPPPNLPAAYSSLIATPGYRVVGPNGPWVEVWFRKSIPTGPKSSDDSIVFPIAQGTLIGILHFPGEAYDRRGQQIKPGVYTLRYSDYPSDGAHQGVAPQRDFALMTPVAQDSDPNAKPAFEALVKMSTQASGTPHPAVLSLETPSSTTFPAVVKEGDTDEALDVKVGDLGIGLIVVGKAQQ
jgi:hypothetical protein